MIWKDTKTVGFGVAGNWLVARWCDAGNVEGSFEQNVLKSDDWKSYQKYEEFSSGIVFNTGYTRPCHK